jgi:UDP-N-acetylmuramate--alanine ligase
VEFASRARRVLVGANDAGARRIGARLGSKALTFGLDQADLLLGNVEQRPSGSRAGLRLPDGRQVTLRLAVPGVHNLRNATAALGVVWSLDGNLEPALEALASYRGLGRRFERLGEVGGVVLVDDYAHHPSELVATLAAARQAFPDRRLVAVFQPHLFSRTASHGIAMGQALAAADLAVVAEIYAAREQPVAGVTAALVVDAAKLAGGQVVYEPDRSRLTERVRDLIKPGDVVLTLGAGDITKVGRELVEWLRAA